MDDWKDEISAKDFFARETELSQTVSAPKTSLPKHFLGRRRRQRGGSQSGRGSCLGGFIFFVFGSFFCLFLLCDMNWRDYGPWTTVPQPGQVVSVEKTGTSINDRPIWRIHFSGETSDRKNISGCSCSAEKYSENVPVVLERQGDVYRIQGTTLGVMGGFWGVFFLLFILIFPGMGLYLMGTAISRHFKEKRNTLSDDLSNSDEKENFIEDLDKNPDKNLVENLVENLAKDLGETDILEERVEPDLRTLPDPPHWEDLGISPRRVSWGAQLALMFCGESIGCFGWIWLVFTTGISLAFFQTQNINEVFSTNLFMVLFLGIFLLVGLGMVVATFYNAWKTIWLLKNGAAAKAWPGKMERTGVVINSRQQYVVEYVFLGQDGQRTTHTIKTLEPERCWGAASETVLYNPDQPQIALVLENLLRSRIHVASEGTFRVLGSTLFLLWFTLGIAAVWAASVWYGITQVFFQ